MQAKGSQVRILSARQCAPDFSRSPGLFLLDFGTPVSNPTQTQHFEFAIRFFRNCDCEGVAQTELYSAESIEIYE
jgi:hypothetical protein